jgi:phosphoenolpyruvate-protein kinase (PTS system EI component)
MTIESAQALQELEQKLRREGFATTSLIEQICTFLGNGHSQHNDIAQIYLRRRARDNRDIRNSLIRYALLAPEKCSQRARSAFP